MKNIIVMAALFALHPAALWADHFHYAIRYRVEYRMGAVTFDFVNVPADAVTALSARSDDGRSVTLEYQ